MDRPQEPTPEEQAAFDADRPQDAYRRVDVFEEATKRDEWVNSLLLAVLLACVSWVLAAQHWNLPQLPFAYFVVAILLAAVLWHYRRLRIARALAKCPQCGKPFQHWDPPNRHRVRIHYCDDCRIFTEELVEPVGEEP